MGVSVSLQPPVGTTELLFLSKFSPLGDRKVIQKIPHVVLHVLVCPNLSFRSVDLTTTMVMFLRKSVSCDVANRFNQSVILRFEPIRTEI